MGFSFLKKQQHCSSENERASGRRRVVLHHHSTELLLYLQMVASSLERPPRTDEDCKKCNHRGAPAAGATGVEEGGHWNPHFQKAKRRLWMKQKKNPKSSKNLSLSSRHFPGECQQRPLFSKKLSWLSEKREIMAFKLQNTSTSLLSWNSRWKK